MTRLLNEWRTIWRIAAPLLVAQLCYTGMGAVDTLVAGRAGLYDLSGVAVGTGVWMPISLFLTGLCYAVSPITARAYGAGQATRVTHVLAQSVWLGGGLGLVAGLALGFGGSSALGWFGMDAQTFAVGAGYLDAIAWGLPGFCLYQALRSYQIGLGTTRAEMVIAVVMVSLNVPLSLALAFGWGALPAMGAVGCGVATSILFWLAALALALVVFARARPSRSQWRPNAGQLNALLALGTPIGIAIFAEASVFAIIALLLAPLGAVAIAGHTIALNLSSIIFMFPLAIAMAATARVGYLRGTGDWALVRFSGLAAIALGCAFAVITCGLTLMFRGTIVAWYGAPNDVQTLAIGLLLLAAVYQIPDAVQVVAAGVLRGWEDSKGPLLVALVCYWLIALPGGMWLGRGWFGQTATGASGFWVFLIVGLTLASVGMGWRLRMHHRSAPNSAL